MALVSAGVWPCLLAWLKFTPLESHLAAAASASGKLDCLPVARLWCVKRKDPREGSKLKLRAGLIPTHSIPCGLPLTSTSGSQLKQEDPLNLSI